MTSPQQMGLFAFRSQSSSSNARVVLRIMVALVLLSLADTVVNCSTYSSNARLIESPETTRAQPTSRTVLTTTSLVDDTTLSTSVNLTDPSVFNGYFYINTYPDLREAGLNSLQQVMDHWLQFGILEGRQACGNFHTQQYIEANPSLAPLFCNTSSSCNFTLALTHYLTIGQPKGLMGVVFGGAFGRYTINSGALFVSGSDRMAAGIDSLVLNNVEYINSHDHGRELQMAITNGFGECFNPTECGSSNDGTGMNTSSVVKFVSSTETYLHSSIEPAFWLAPGQAEPAPTPTCAVGINAGLVSNYTITKHVSVDPASIPSGVTTPCVYFNATVLVATPCATIQVEGPTGYLNANFDTFWGFNTTTRELTSLAQPGNQSVTPEGYSIISTSDASSAMGAISINFDTSIFDLYNTMFWFYNDEYGTDTSKWSLVHRARTTVTSIAEGTILAFHSYICIGTLSEVQDCLVAVYNTTLV